MIVAAVPDAGRAAHIVRTDSGPIDMLRSMARTAGREKGSGPVSTTNAEYAKTLAMPPEWQAKAAAFADAKGLSFAAREVVAEFRDEWVGRDGKKRAAQLVLIVTADALIAQALNGGRKFAPIRTEFTDDGREWVEAWLGTSPPAACRIVFEVEGVSQPVSIVHTWAEYVQGHATVTQAKMPALMLSKATLVMGARRIAPHAVAGLYSPEEAESIESGAVADREHADAVGDAVIPPSESEVKGSKVSRAEQYAARKDELIRAGKALRAECGDEAAERLAVVVNNMRQNAGMDLDKITQVQLKQILAAEKEIRASAGQAIPPAAPAPDPSPDPEPPAEPAGAQPPADVQSLADEFDGEFVI